MPWFSGLVSGMLSSPDPCANAPGISSISLYTEEMNECFGGGYQGWHLTYRVNLVATLKATQEIYVEYATNSAGDNWATLGSFTDIDTTIEVDYNDQNVGSDGAGGNITVYNRIRAWVVPIGGDDTNACSGPTTYGTVESVTENSCFA